MASETREISREAQRQMEVFKQGTVEVLPEDEMLERIQASLDEDRPLRVKLGADPSAPDLHLGHMVQIRKLRQFQDFGHTVVFIIGDFTAMIGDPSGKSETRPRLTPEQVKENAMTYFDQVFMTLDRDKTEVVYNSDWLGKLSLADVIELAAKQTVARMLERDDFEKRFRSEQAIYIHEFLYPLAQAYDSVAVRADIEIGGTDQKFNLLLGREIQREMGQKPQSILTLPLLVGTDGEKKMSKSLGNYIGITEPAHDAYGKAMSIGDELMGTYLQLVLGYSDEEVEAMLADLQGGRVHPRDLKARIAFEIVENFHGKQAAEESREHFDRVFRERQAPEEMPEVTIHLEAEAPDIWVAPLLVEAGLAKSNRQARKAISEGSVRKDGEKIAQEDARVEPGEYVMQVGKRNFRRVRVTH